MLKRKFGWSFVLLMFTLTILPLLSVAKCESTGLAYVNNIDDAMSYLDFPEENQKASVVQGRIRYIAQKKDAPYFLDEYWIGGEKNSKFDLSKNQIKGRHYSSYCNNMCTRAVFSMALSYLGYDCTPGDMSWLLKSRDIAMPYDSVIKKIDGISRVTAKELNLLNKKFEKYQTDPHYSPIMLHLQKSDGDPHALLIIAKDEDGWFIVVDPAKRYYNSELAVIQKVKLDRKCRTVLKSSIPRTYQDARVVQCYQWYRDDEETTAIEK